MEEIICKKCNIRFNNLKQLTKHINDYHIFSVKEYYDMYLKQEGEGICPVCGKETNFKSTRYGYYKTCSHKCHTYLQNKLYSAKEKNKINEKRKNTWNKKDLAEYKNIQHNIQKQRYDSYSDEKKKEIANSISNSLQNRSEEEKLISNKKISDSLKHYYLENPEEKEKISKRVSIWLINHWKNLSYEDRKIELEKVDNRLHHFSDERKKEINEKRILTFKNKTKEEKQKSNALGIETKRKNGTLNISIPELRCKELLTTKFITNYQYKSKEYPYYCDFYLPELDLYIECNFHWTHGGHMFDENNPNDIKIVNEWKNKNTNYYNTAVYVWTILDPKKYEFAIKNNLNYLTFYSENDFINWFYSL